jgi:hypothetical protein
LTVRFKGLDTKTACTFSKNVNLAAFSPDGKTLATADQNGRTCLRGIPGRGSAS